MIFASIFSSQVYADSCTAEIEKTTSEMTFGQIIELVENEIEGDDSFIQALKSFGTIVDFGQGRQFYRSNSQFYRETAYFNGGVLEGEYIGVVFSGTLSPSSPFGLFIGFDIKSCKLRSVSLDLPL
ncbi:hypothetical protein NFC81_02720 [Salinispirillum sp. LH 10-3-1]|uniref:DUF3887 domain-containing protein n=1 Tax=Salinispirillum sp. LH 10-3-1 TaxID=2952525 RepID=A0AB38YHP3_9GAMM